MQIKFKPNYIITSKVMNCLMRIEAAKERVLYLPLTPTVLNSLRETARLYTTHYSTMIEGNRLIPDQIEVILKHEGHFPGRERDEHEVKGYYAALTQVERWAASGTNLTEKMIQTLHALVMADGKSNVKPTKYRDGQNVIRDGRTKAIVYMPPEAKDVSKLMTGMVNWIEKNTELPCPIIAGIIHYQFATIHPYYDGNGRTARLLTTLILHLGNYDLKGLYSLEEYYARNLGAYYEAISIGESHNYYIGRAEADITKWLEYFIEGIAVSFENVLKRMVEAEAQGSPDQTTLLRKLDPRQRKALQLFQEFETITSNQIGKLFGFKPRTSAALCASWVENGFLEIVDSSNKGRKYKLSEQYENLIISTNAIR
ncbi:Fic family protein [Rickettsia endosymbiont of Polydrusus tereticollis]|uniref:Fic family protein n=1 Tax=Rickettsia endosymbiont of Polydrusus tereticollis TaxID=3066251 RepID=UPI003132DC54